MKYYINGWQESKSYFLSFGFSEKELEALKNGKIIKKGNNTFYIVID